MRSRSTASATAKVSSGVHSPRRRRTRVPCIWSSPISAGRNSLVLRALNKLPIATVTVREGARSLDTALDEMAQVFRFVSLDAELALRLREEPADLVDRRSPMTLLVTHITFADLRPSKLIGGIHSSAITQGEAQEMPAEYIPAAYSTVRGQA